MRGYVVTDFTLDEFVDELLLGSVFPAIEAQIITPDEAILSGVIATADFAVLWMADGQKFAGLYVDYFSRLRNVFPVVGTWWMVPLEAESQPVLPVLFGTAIDVRESFLDAGVGPDLEAWYRGKAIVPVAVCARVAREVRGRLAAARGESKKLIVVDGDGTLWGGEVGEVGADAVRFGAPHADGEAFADFQRALLALKNQGVMLALATKNDLDAVRPLLDGRMVLSENDFVAVLAGWQTKDQSIQSAAKLANVLLDHTVFIDNSAVERHFVRRALPEVFVPEWPETPYTAVQRLRSLHAFYRTTVTEEDKRRTEMVQENQARESLRKELSYGEWIASLGTSVLMEVVSASSRARAIELLNKTNQMKLTGRKYEASDLTDRTLVFSVSDRFGSYGLVGVVMLDEEGTIIEFAVSCRVLDRGVEETILRAALAWEQGYLGQVRQGKRSIEVEFEHTARNKKCYGLLNSLRASSRTPGPLKERFSINPRWQPGISCGLSSDVERTVLRARFLERVKEVLGRARITEVELGSLSSLAKVRLISELEREFGGPLDEKKLFGSELSLDALVDLVFWGFV